MACTWALKNRLLGRDPLIGLDRPLSAAKTMKCWSTEEAQSFLACTRDDRLYFAWSLFLTRGLRRGELCGLHWADVDLDVPKPVLRINQTRVTAEGKAIDSSPKTENGRRSVRLDESLVSILRSHKARQATEKLAADGGAYEEHGGGGFLLADELGRPCHPDTLSGWFDNAIAKTDLPRIRLHDTRHTAASLMLAQGTPVKVVSEMLGHFSPTITLEIYAHVLPGMAEEAGAALSDSLLG